MAEFKSSENGAKPSKSSITSAPDAEGPSRLEQLLTYPSLERLFEGNDPKMLDDMRSRLTRTHQTLERVIRQGTHEDATSAARIAEAYDLTLGLLAELEAARRKL